MKKRKKKLKKIIVNTILYTICWRNVDKLNDIWIYAKYDLLGGEKRCLNLLKIILVIF